MFSVIGVKYNRSCPANAPRAVLRCMNSTLLPDFDQGSILEEMKTYTYWYIGECMRQNLSFNENNDFRL